MKTLHSYRKWNRIVVVFLLVLHPATSVAGMPRFVSLEGRFSISLPDRPSFRKAMILTPVGDVPGNLYEWETKEGFIGVGYADSVQPINDPEAVQQFFDAASERFRRFAVANGGDIAVVKKITLDNRPGIEQRAGFGRGWTFRRLYLVSRRTYEIYVTIKKSQREVESAVVGVLDSFKLLSDPEITEEALKAGPGPLPQEPAVPRAGSDAADEGLRGPVKSVHTELQYLSETVLMMGGTKSTLTTYNKNGNMVRTESYDFKNNLSDIVVYGYLEGSRVSASKSIQREYSLPVGRLGGLPSKKRMDPRYQNRFEFKYDEKKRLTEKTYSSSDGGFGERSVYKYQGNQKEELVYSEDGSLIRRNLYILDDKGNVIESTGLRSDGSVYAKRTYTYEFDSRGNWTRQTSSGNVVSDKRGLEPPSVRVRTITYY